MGDTNEPKYQRLMRRLRSMIDELEVGAPVPSERQLAEQSGVSRMTARRALDELEGKGLVSREVGRGSFVVRPSVSLPLRLSSFSDDMKGRGLTPSSRVLVSEVAADPEAALALGVAVDEPIVRLDRVRLADGRPMAIERARLVAARVPDLLQHFDPSADSLYAVLGQRYGLRFDTGEQAIRAGIVNEADGDLLMITPGGPVLELVRDTAEAQRPIEHTVSIYPGERFELRAGISPAPPQGSASALRSR